MNFFDYFLMISMTLTAAAGFVFLWHRWNVVRTPISLILAIAVSVPVAIASAFAIATLILHLMIP